MGMYADSMRYEIKCDGKVIARFLYESDRDLCLVAMREAFDDVVIEAADQGKKT
ncbi:unnamed protein product [marine sediment metagenome]|uniref:Uncharacterized protein n=1 Tax=marine sediment metagenome TaxID=412755 RepID=X0XKN9_9ZZZZ